MDQHFDQLTFTIAISGGALIKQLSVEYGVLKRILVEDTQIPEINRAGFVVELINHPTESEWLDWKNLNVRGQEKFSTVLHDGKIYWISEGRWDFFISHASRVKDSIAWPLAQALKKRGQKVWFDKLEIKVGDDIGKVIEFGINSSLFGVVILSEDFFGRRWTEAELDALSQIRIFLILHGVEAEKLGELRPGLEDRLAVDSSMGAEEIADKLVEAIQAPQRLVT